MKRKILTILVSSCILVFLIWGILALFFPIVSIDGNFYSQRAILQLKKQRLAFFDGCINSFSEKMNQNIENQYSLYMDNIKKMIFPDLRDRSLSKIFKELFSEINASESKFIVEFEHIIQYKAWSFTVPLQIRNRTSKNAVLKDIFSSRIRNYSINDRIYHGLTIDILLRKLEAFNDEFPPSVQEAIESIINSQYEQCLKNLKSRDDINIDIYNSLNDDILSLREQGKTLSFFKHLIEACDITDVVNNSYSSVEPLDISKNTNPVLLPVHTINEEVYDIYALNTVKKKLEQFRDDWKQDREESIEEIINSQRETMIQNLTARISIDENIDIERLPVLLDYYERQADISENFFAFTLEQCHVDWNGNFKTQEAVDISPLSIDAVSIEGRLYDKIALTVLAKNIATLREGWNKFIASEEKVIQNKFQNYYDDIIAQRTIDIDKENVGSVMDYITEQSDISRDLFLYFYDCCSILPENHTGAVADGDTEGIDSTPLLLNAVEIDGTAYYAAAIKAMQESMGIVTDDIIIKIQNDIVI